MSDRLIVFDTTLRDGEQSPGASMTSDEKLTIAKALEKMRVDIIEAGFPAASPGDFEAVKLVAKEIKDSTVCALARAVAGDLQKAARSVQGARSGRIHTFIATSPIHMREKLRLSEDQVLERAVWAVKTARNYTDDVEFSPEDAGRSDLDFLCRVLEAAIKAGARTVNIPDTVGYNLPGQFADLIKNLMEKIPNSDQAIFSVHCHNDLGLAVANSLAAVQVGARQVECTINGLGERAGNASLEEIVMAVRTRQDFFHCDTQIDATQIVPTSRLVSSVTGFAIQPNKAIVGANAFAHESGIHQDGVIKKRETYEIMRAQDVGWSNNRMVLGKHSGRHAFKQRMKELGFELETEEDIRSAFAKFKRLADRKHEIFDDDLVGLMVDSNFVLNEGRVRLESLRVSSDSGKHSTASLGLCIDGESLQATADGNGPVDASFQAVKSLVASDPVLELYSVHSITGGTDALGEVSVRLKENGRIVNGHGADTDIVIASVRAYIDALNRLDCSTQSHPQKDSMI